MRRAITGGLSIALVFYAAVSCLGYAALGDATPGDVLTAFEAPRWLVAAANAMVLVHMISAFQVCVCVCVRARKKHVPRTQGGMFSRGWS
jgi:amino acid permease